MKSLSLEVLKKCVDVMLKDVVSRHGSDGLMAVLDLSGVVSSSLYVSLILKFILASRELYSCIIY